MGDGVAVYDLHPQRGAGALQAVIGLDGEGVLVPDGWAAYDRSEEASHQQCVAHVLRRVREKKLSPKASPWFTSAGDRMRPLSNRSDSTKRATSWMTSLAVSSPKGSVNCAEVRPC